MFMMNFYKWLFRCLDTISHKVENYGQYEWQIISGIKDNDYEYDLMIQMIFLMMLQKNLKL